jgi:hypothetical protein
VCVTSIEDVIRLRPRWIVEKYASDEDFAAGKAYEVRVTDGNLLTTTGATLMWNLLIGAGGTVYSNANANLGVGDSTTAEAAAQTDLQAAANKLRKGMEATYPSVATNVLTFKSSFGSTEANYAWAEMAVFNAAAAGTMLCRKVSAQGTKTSGQIWVLTYTNTAS